MQPFILHDLDYYDILIHPRIHEWYVGTGSECMAIQRQDYLSEGSVKNDTVKAVMRRDDMSEPEAIAQIIFQHQLPIALIKTIIQYGERIAYGQEDTFTLHAPVEFQQGDLDCHHYLGEVTGRVEGTAIKIWHSFLRDCTLKNNCEITFHHDELEEAIETEITYILQQTGTDAIKEVTEEFFHLESLDNWTITDTLTYVEITKENKVFTVLKDKGKG